MIKAVRGAIQVGEDREELIRSAVLSLIEGVMGLNQLEEKDIVSIQFTVTEDLYAINPAEALRSGGFSQTPLFSAQEPRCRGELPRIIRTMILCNSEGEAPLKPLYLGGAAALRPDLATGDGR